MNREEALEYYTVNTCDICGNENVNIDDVIKSIYEEHEAEIKDKNIAIRNFGEVYAEHEAQLKAKDDKYHELKDLFNSLDEQHDLLKLKNIELVERGNRTCFNCNLRNGDYSCDAINHSNTLIQSDFGCNRWEKKDV